jgi:hypothetical protein
MRRIGWTIAMVFMLSAFGASPVQAQMGSGAMRGMDWRHDYERQKGGGWHYCPYCGESLDRRDRRPEGPAGRYGGFRDRRGMRGGMMRPGWDMCEPGVMGPCWGMGPGYQRPVIKMSRDEVKDMMQRYLDDTGNPNLKLGNIQDRHMVFEVEILTKKKGSLVDKILVDKYSGWVRSVYDREGYIQRTPMDRDRARELVAEYLKERRNPNLKTGDVRETESAFEIEILTGDGDLVDRIAVDRKTGWMRSVY